MDGLSRTARLPEKFGAWTAPDIRRSEMPSRSRYQSGLASVSRKYDRDLQRLTGASSQDGRVIEKTVYIALRTGGGRGVYEIAGETATGLTSADLLGRQLVFDFSPGLQLPSGVALDVQGGKHRLRMVTAYIQIQRQFAAAMMMPSPRRVNNTGWSQQVLTSKEYVIDRINIEFANHLIPNTAFVVPGPIETRNLAHELTINAQQRFAEVRRVWEDRARLPEPLQPLVSRHEQFVTAGCPIGMDCERAVSDIQRVAHHLWPDELQASADAVPILANHLGLEEAELENSSIGIVPVAQFELGNILPVPQRIRRAMVERRGQWSFRQGLLVAYGSKCQVTQYTGEPALEAAHIYPYSKGGEYTNDLRNGLLLRADIHTLFDLGLLKVAPESLQVRVMDPLVNSSYSTLDGTVLQTSPDLQPSNEALEYKWTENSI